jgi:plasmid stabilization system protein ParE
LTRVRLRATAKRDFREAIAWYRDRNEEVATRFAAEVRQVFAHLERFPFTGGVVPGLKDPDVRRFPVHGFPYSVVFLRLGSKISVLAIAHSRRRPGYWDE